MGLLLIMALLLAWHGLARCFSVLWDGAWGWEYHFLAVCDHGIGLGVMAMLLGLYMIVRNIDWPAVGHWLLYMNKGGEG